MLGRSPGGSRSTDGSRGNNRVFGLGPLGDSVPGRAPVGNLKGGAQVLGLDPLRNRVFDRFGAAPLSRSATCPADMLAVSGRSGSPLVPYDIAFCSLTRDSAAVWDAML